MHPALRCIGEATRGTRYEGRLYLVGGAVRDELLGVAHNADFDLVLEGDALRVAWLLWEERTSEIPPVVYPRFGTAMVHVLGAQIELVTARRESYNQSSRKPDVEPATLKEDALRRDFTVNTLMRNLHSGELVDPLGVGVADLRAGLLRTPMDPAETFFDDPLRMLRAVRFRRKLGFELAPGVEQAIVAEAARLSIISMERIRDELVKMLALPDADRCMDDLLGLGLLDQFAPEFRALVGVEQGSFHHLDAWQHTLLTLRNAGSGDLTLSLACLLHDIAKPQTRTVDEQGRTHFYEHDRRGAAMAREILRRLRFSTAQTEAVALLVRNHMRIASPQRFTDTAARRLLRDLGDQLERFLALLAADAAALKPGAKEFDLSSVRARLDAVAKQTPVSNLQSPLTGLEIMVALGVSEGPLVGKVKDHLLEEILEGRLDPSDREAALRAARSYGRNLLRDLRVQSGI